MSRILLVLLRLEVATNVIAEVEEFVITGIDLDGLTIDWINIAEVGDYLEFVRKRWWRHSAL